MKIKKKFGGARRSRAKDTTLRSRDDKCPPASSLKVVLSEIPIAVAKVDATSSHGGKVDAIDENAPPADAPSASIDAPEVAAPNAPLIAKEESRDDDNCYGDPDDDTCDDTEVQSSRDPGSKDFSVNLLPELDSLLRENKWLSMGANALLRAIEGADNPIDDDSAHGGTQDRSISDGESWYSTSTGGRRHSTLHGENDDDSIVGSISDGESRTLYSTFTGEESNVDYNVVTLPLDENPEALRAETNGRAPTRPMSKRESNPSRSTKQARTTGIFSSSRGFPAVRPFGFASARNSKSQRLPQAPPSQPTEENSAIFMNTSTIMSRTSKALRSASPFKNSASHAHKAPRAPPQTTDVNSSASSRETDENLNNENASINGRTSNNLRRGANPSKFARAYPRTPEENSLLCSKVPKAGANAHKPPTLAESFDVSVLISELDGNRMADDTAELMNNIETVLEGV